MRSSVRTLLAVAAAALAAGLSSPSTAPAAPGPPTAVLDSFGGLEGEPCLLIDLAENDRLGDVPVLRRLVAHPSGGGVLANGKLFRYDPTAPDDLGAQLVVDGDAAAADEPLCYQPNQRFFHGTDVFFYVLVDAASGAPITSPTLVNLDVAEEGTGPPSGRSEGPSGLVAVPGDGEVTLSWEAGGPDVTRVYAFVDGMVVDERPVAPTSGSLVYGGLTNGVAYSFSASGTGTSGAAPSNVVVPGVLPGVPTGVAAARASGDVAVSWQAPAELGDPALTGYRVGVTVDGVLRAPIDVPAATTVVTVPAMPDTARVEITVTATGVVGVGPASAAAVLEPLPQVPDDEDPPTGPSPPRRMPAPALASFALASPCARPNATGVVRTRFVLGMRGPRRPLVVRIDRARGTKGLAACPARNPRRRFRGRFAHVRTIVRRPATAAAAAANPSRRTVALSLRLRPGLYRITARIGDDGRLSAPRTRFLRVLSPR
jgi:hypothetical protein